MSSASARRRARNWAALVLAAGVLGSSLASAQNDPFGRGLGGGSDFGPPRGPENEPPQKKQPEAPEGAPELHAASGGESLITPGQEPSLPERPLKISDAVLKRIGTDTKADEPELGRGGEKSRHFYGLWYDERDGDYSLKTLFPFWLERRQPSRSNPEVEDRASLYGGLYYNRRSAGRADDVLFPLFWNMRDNDSRTTVVGPFVNRVAPNETDNWLAPLYFTGTRKSGGYTIIPPLLTYTNHDDDGGFTMFGPVFCSWSGFGSCDRDRAKDVDRGVFPLYFDGQDDSGSYRLIPPLLHYTSNNTKTDSWVNVWGPVYRAHSPKRDKLHVFPLYFSLWGENERHTTLLPFFHYGHDEKSSLFVNPLFLTASGEHGESTFATWGYARYRGRTELDMITPLYWGYRDPDIGLDQHLLFPFFYRRTSPRENDIALFPFFGYFERYGVETEYWVTPLFRHSHGLRGWSTSLYPFFHVGRDGYDTHTVVAPFYFDFAGRDSRATVGFPFYWRFAKRDRLTQLIGNVYYSERQLKRGTDWEIHVFPAFSYGETPDGHWWNILYGLAGYKRQGSLTRIRTLWIPITLSE